MSSAAAMPDNGLHGLLAEFESPEALVTAARRARDSGFTKMDAYTPFPVEELSDALGHKRSRVPLVVLIGGLIGGLTGLGLQYWSAVIRYPMIVGGRPHISWPAWIVVTFESTILFASLFGVLGMILLNRLPEPYHPVFNVERFGLASQDRYFLCIEAADPRFDRRATEGFLRDLNPNEVSEVEI
jgi:hypothetical protein